jgi:PAS domain S-box-containing protein
MNTPPDRIFALIANHTDNSVVFTDASGKIIWVNPAFTRLTGYALEEVVGKTPGSFLQGPATDPATVRYMHDRLRAGQGFQVELINYSKTGRKYWVASEVRPICEADGRVANFMAIQIEISERKRAEELLLRANALHRGMLEGAGYAIIATDTDGIIQLFNSAAERLLGYAAAEMVGKLTPAVFHDRDEITRRAAELSRELGREVQPGFATFVAKAELGQPDQREWTYIRKDGARLPVLLSVTALFDEHQKIIGYLGVATDLSERKRGEEKIRVTLSEVERMNRVMMNRERRVLELKTEINQMCLAAGLPPAYPAALESNESQQASK